jgi:hypothetical protein
LNTTVLSHISQNSIPIQATTESHDRIHHTIEFHSIRQNTPEYPRIPQSTTKEIKNLRIFLRKRNSEKRKIFLKKTKKKIISQKIYSEKKYIFVGMEINSY